MQMPEYTSGAMQLYYIRQDESKDYPEAFGEFQCGGHMVSGIISV